MCFLFGNFFDYSVPGHLFGGSRFMLVHLSIVPLDVIVRGNVKFKVA